MTRKADDGIVWRGPDPLRPLLVPIDSISAWPDNPRQGDAGAVAASMARFGQQKPIVVQKSTGWIVAGNHTWLAAPMVGEMERVLQFGAMKDWTHIAVVFSELDDVQAKAYAIADNRTSELGTYNEEGLARILTELATAGQLTGTGYDGDDVDNLLAELRPRVPIDVPRSEPSLGSEITIEIHCGRDFLDEIERMLAEWGRREGVTVSIA